MKNILKKCIAGINKLMLRYFSAFGSNAKGNSFYLVSAKTDKKQSFSLISSVFEKCKLHVEGQGNSLFITNAIVSNTDILIQGKNNELVLDPGVKLCGAKIIMRGNECSIRIGRNTSFGGIRIVNVGQHCAITIGAECMFADQIELWASDTHPIFDAQGGIINHERSITIGDKVWVGCRAVVLKGVNIGSGSVIGMGTVVTSDIPAHAISAGHPNRTLRSDISWSMYYPGGERIAP